MFFLSSYVFSLFFFFLLIPRPPSSTLFPYTTLFRSMRRTAITGRIPTRRRPASGVACGTVITGFAPATPDAGRDRKSTRLNSSHLGISYAVFCLKKKKKRKENTNKTNRYIHNTTQMY